MKPSLLKSIAHSAITFCTLLGLSLPALASYDFSATCASGQVLYYSINNHSVSTTFPGTTPGYAYNGLHKPTGALTIPTTVTYNGNTYSVTSIGSSTFYDCNGLTSVTIPNSITFIDYAAFNGCSGLTSVTIPNSVTIISSYAFSDCSGLTSITIPNSVTSICPCAFFGCSGLTSITIPNSVTEIGMSAFSDCSGLTSVTIGKSVTSIDYGAFDGCIAILSVTSKAVVAPTLDDEAFYSIPNTTPLLIPHGSRDSYVAKGWDNYFDIREQSSIVRTNATTYTIGTDDMRIVVRGAEGQRIRIYDNTGRLLSNTPSAEDVCICVMPATGIYMVQMDNDPAHRVVLIH